MTWFEIGVLVLLFLILSALGRLVVVMSVFASAVDHLRAIAEVERNRDVRESDEHRREDAVRWAAQREEKSKPAVEPR